METKVSRSDRGILRGTSLSWGLALLLALGAIALDSYRGNWQALGNSLTLPWLLTALASALMGRWGVPQLRQLKLKQSIRQEGPQAHLKKAGTPTMGGILFVPVAVAIRPGLGLSQPRHHRRSPNCSLGRLPPHLSLRVYWLAR